MIPIKKQRTDFKLDLSTNKSSGILVYAISYLSKCQTKNITKIYHSESSNINLAYISDILPLKTIFYLLSQKKRNQSDKVLPFASLCILIVTSVLIIISAILVIINIIIVIIIVILVLSSVTLVISSEMLVIIIVILVIKRVTIVINSAHTLVYMKLFDINISKNPVYCNRICNTMSLTTHVIEYKYICLVYDKYCQKNKCNYLYNFCTTQIQYRIKITCAKSYNCYVITYKYFITIYEHRE